MTSGGALAYRQDPLARDALQHSRRPIQDTTLVRFGSVNGAHSMTARMALSTAVTTRPESTATVRTEPEPTWLPWPESVEINENLMLVDFCEHMNFTGS